VRPSKEFTFMTIAKVWAKQSTCPKLHVGCVLVNSQDQIIASGYNGRPKNFPHCLETNCDNGEFHGVVHSELNAIIACAMNGVSTKNTRLFVTSCPCFRCSLAIIQSGIKEVIYLYNPLETSIKLLQLGKVLVRELK